MRGTTWLVAILTLNAVTGEAQHRTFHAGLPAVSPDGRYIAFVATIDSGPSDLYVIRCDGTGRQRLTSTPANEGTIRWLPDGRIKFEQFSPDTTRVWTIRPDGTGLTPWVSVAGREVVPTPDGKGFLFQSGRMPDTRVARAALDGTIQAYLTEPGERTFNLTWSPDGKTIAFATFTAPRQLQVGIMNPDGTGRRLLTTFTAAEGSPQWPSWSPDGTRLAVQANEQNPNGRGAIRSHIWLIDIETGHPTKLAAHDAPWLDETPSWFPDGRRIAFQSDRSGAMEVWVMNADGTGPRQLTR